MPNIISSDYELHTRPYISALIITGSLLFSAGYSLIFALNFFTFFASTFLIAFVAMAKYVMTTHAVYVALCQICLMAVYVGVESNNWEIFIYIMDTVVF
uniref:Uncharacterized protein n=1 Tax=Caenorhabditis japonica TaxID=281687 RepID=A0A8R1DKJ8_CAEJA